MQTWIKALIGATVGIGALLLVILVPLSLHRVEFGEVAVSYDKVSRKLGTEVLEEGLHDLGPSGSLVRFTTTLRTAQYENMAMLTKDGLPVWLDVSVTYRIVISEVRDIILEFGDQEAHDAFISTAVASKIRDIATSFDAKQYYQQREDLQTALSQEIAKLFSASNLHAKMTFSQLVNIELARVVSRALEETTTAMQNIANVLTERGKAVQTAEIAHSVAAGQAKLTILGAQREAAEIDQNTEQLVLQELTKMQLRSFAFGNISLGLAQGGDYFVDTYLKSLVLDQSDGKTVIGL